MDGSDEEWDRLTSLLVESGTFTRLNPDKKPNSFHAASDPSDVARVEDRTFICSEKEEDAGFTNNWKSPSEMKATMTDLYRGSMTGRTMYVIPFVMGHIDADVPMFGIEITDSAYVVVVDEDHGPHRRAGSRRDRGQPRRVRRPGPALGRLPADRRPPGRRLAVQRHQVHRPLPRDARDLVLRLGLRRQRPARQEVLRPAHRLGDGTRRGLDGRAHAHPQARLAAGHQALHRGCLPERLRQDQPRDDRPHPRGLDRRDGR